MAGVSFLITFYFYRIYQARYLLEQYRRNTSNALAHDLKTPLMAISGYAENLRANVHTEKKDYYADAIANSVNDMNHIVEQMLEFAKAEKLEVIKKTESVDLRSMTETVLEQFQFMLEEKMIHVCIKGEVCIEADRELMNRAVENLIGNAVVHTPGNQNIYIEMDKKHYRITNTGVAVSNQKLERLWEPFVKGDDARGCGNGTGIGMALIKEILDAHRFGYDLSSENDSFTVTVYF